jgi:hypothetical protein
MAYGPARTPALESELDPDVRAAVGPALRRDEAVWAVLHGADGTTLVATQERMFVSHGATVTAWPLDTLDDLLVVPGGVLLRRRDDLSHIVTVPLARNPGETEIQSVTVIALLVARAQREAWRAGATRGH